MKVSKQSHQQVPVEGPWASDATEVLDILGVDAGNGLSEQEARRRLHQYGSNLLKLTRPRSVLAIDWLLSLLAVGGLRFAMRLLAEGRSGDIGIQVRAKRILIVGAGDAGALVVREMQKN